MPLGRKLRYGMVGGGPGAFIGAVHRKAAALDGELDLVAGAFSSNADKSQQQGAELMLDPARSRNRPASSIISSNMTTPTIRWRASRRAMLISKNYVSSITR